ELLSGRRPFGGTVGEVIGQVIHVEPEPPSKVRHDADARLEAICLKAMAKDPAARYASMRELGNALGEYLREGPPKPEPSPASPSTAAGAAPPPAIQEVIAELVTEPSAAPGKCDRYGRQAPAWLRAADPVGAELIVTILAKTIMSMQRG